MPLPNLKPDFPFIPIHTSDRGTFKRCHRRWWFTSPIMMNLSPKVSYFGVIWPLDFGSLVHMALEEYYRPGPLKRDPVEVFMTEFTAWKRRINEVAPNYIEENREAFDEHYEMGISMLNYYKTYAEDHDDFDVIEVEHDFYVPLDMDMPDPRDSGKIKPVYYCGRMDAVVQSHSTGVYGILDHKTSARFDEEFFTKLEMDEQCSSYLTCAEIEAQTYDLPYKEVNDIIYNVLRKGCIRPPTVLQSGFLSVDRQKESTTAELFDAEVKRRNLYEWFNESPKIQSYYEWLQGEGGRYVFREPVKRNPHEKNAVWDRIRIEAHDMLSRAEDQRIDGGTEILYPNPTGDWYCKGCAFRAPCLAMNDGSDWQYMLDNQYEQSAYGLARGAKPSLVIG